MRALLILIFFSIFSLNIYSQDSLEIARKERCEKYIKKVYLSGVYIPKDIKDAFAELDNKISENDKKRYKSLPEELVVQKLFFGFGKWMRVNWKLDDCSRLTNYFHFSGITYPDDMVALLMITYHRHLYNKEIDFDILVKEILEKRKQMWEKRKKEAKVISEYKIDK